MIHVTDLTKRLVTLPPAGDDLMGLRRILHDCENDPEPEFTAQLDAVEAFTAALRGELDKPTEQEAQAAECAEIADKFGTVSEAEQAAYGDAVTTTVEPGSPEWYALIPELPFGVTILEKRRDEILATFRDEPLSREEAETLIEELAEIESSL